MSQKISGVWCEVTLYNIVAKIKGYRFFFLQTLDDLCLMNSDLDPDVGQFVEMIWKEATQEAEKMLTMSMEHIKSDKVCILIYHCCLFQVKLKKAVVNVQNKLYALFCSYM